MQNAQQRKYLGEFETKIEIILGGLSGANMGLFGKLLYTKYFLHMSTFNTLINLVSFLCVK
jgi:hypothetical protein